MAYSDFTLDRLIQDFGVDVRGEQNMFADAPAVEPSPWLTESLQRAKDMGYGNEKSRSERLVSPILAELSSRNGGAFAEAVAGGDKAIRYATADVGSALDRAGDAVCDGGTEAGNERRGLE